MAARIIAIVGVCLLVAGVLITGITLEVSDIQPGTVADALERAPLPIFLQPAGGRWTRGIFRYNVGPLRIQIGDTEIIIGE